MRGERFGHHRAHRDDRRLGAGARLAQPVAAGERVGLPASSARSTCAIERVERRR
jgi:hypothetical protein